MLGITILNTKAKWGCGHVVNKRWKDSRILLRKRNERFQETEAEMLVSILVAMRA
jgi:hypothetical protein